jgi:hypothetical protein
VSGRELIAHELVHIVQQVSGRVRGDGPRPIVRSAGDRFEREAEALAPIVAALASDQRARRGDRRRRRARGQRRILGVIQRSARKLVSASQQRPPLAAAGGPHTCHDAALGWVLTAESYSHPWQLVTEVKSKLGQAHTNIPHWIRNIYSVSTKLTDADVTGASPAPRPGDILFTKDLGGSIWHSMVVVSATSGHVYIRGFNNAGTFNYPEINIPALPGAYDPVDRDVAPPNLWHGLAHVRVFGQANGNNLPSTYLWLIRYADVASALKATLVHWTYSLLRTPGWQHTGGPPCFPQCPH